MDKNNIQLANEVTDEVYNEIQKTSQSYSEEEIAILKQNTIKEFLSSDEYKQLQKDWIKRTQSDMLSKYLEENKINIEKTENEIKSKTLPNIDDKPKPVDNSSIIKSELESFGIKLRANLNNN